MENNTPQEHRPENNRDDSEHDATWQRWKASVLPEHHEEAQALYDGQPGALLVYLDNYYLDEQPADIRADFTSIYTGSYPDRAAWATEIIEVLGWDAELRRAVQDAGIPDNAVAWQAEALLDFAQSMGFTVHEYGGEVHVFHE